MDLIKENWVSPAMKGVFIEQSKISDSQKRKRTKYMWPWVKIQYISIPRKGTNKLDTFSLQPSKFLGLTQV